METLLAALAALPERIRASELAQILRVTDETIRAWSRIGKLPAPMVIGGRTQVWDRNEVITFIQAQQAHRAVYAS